MTIGVDDFCVIAAVNNDFILEECLSASPDIASGRLTLTVVRNAKTMAEAYNRGLSQTNQPICIFVHQDVYLPAGWLDKTIAALNSMDQHQPDWMVAGPYGVRSDGGHIGRVWDVNMGRELGVKGFGPTPVGSLDELLLILKRQAGFKVDPNMPSFHMYGTDLVQSAWAAGRSAYAVELPVVHNNRPWSSLGGGYLEAYRYARKKWRSNLPIYTTVCALTYNPIPLWRVRWRRRKMAEREGVLLANAPEVAQRAGYE